MRQNLAQTDKPIEMIASAVLSSATNSTAVNIGGWEGGVMTCFFNAAAGGFVVLQTAPSDGSGAAPSGGSFVNETGLSVTIAGTFATVAFDTDLLERGPWMRVRAVPSSPAGVTVALTLRNQKGPVLASTTFTASRLN